MIPIKIKNILNGILYIVFLCVIFFAARDIKTAIVRNRMQKTVDAVTLENASQDGETITITKKDLMDRYCAPEYESRYYYSQLSDDDKVIYGAIYEGLSSGASYVKVPYASLLHTEDCFRAHSAVILDCPEIFWIKKVYFTNTGKGEYEYKYDFYDYWEYSSDRDDQRARLDAAAEELASEAAKLPTVYDRVQFVHDRLINDASYDHDSLEEARKTVHDGKYDYIYTAYGCLVNHACVCAGYSKAFQLVMNKLGIPCLYVTGEAVGNTSNLGHGWNCVCIDDNYYYVDVTWDDTSIPTSDKGIVFPDEPDYFNFCITTEELEKSHIIGESKFAVPICDDEEYNYFAYNDFIVEEHNLEKEINILERQSEKSRRLIKFTTSDVKDQAWSAINDIFKGLAPVEDMQCLIYGFTNQNVIRFTYGYQEQ